MLPNGVKMTISTTGTGTSLSCSSVTGFPTFNDSCATGEHVLCTISDGNNWEWLEVSVGATNTLTIEKVLQKYESGTLSYNPATPVSLSGSAVISPTAQGSNLISAFPHPAALSPMTNPWVCSANLASGQTNLSTAAAQRNTVWPFLLMNAGVITSMGINCSIAGASSTTLLGLYEPLITGDPGRLITQTSSTLDTSTTGIKTQAVDNQVYLSPGWYWAAILVTAGTNPSFTGYTVAHSGAFGSDGQNLLGNIRHDATETSFADPFSTTSLVDVSAASPSAPLIGLIMS